MARRTKVEERLPDHGPRLRALRESLGIPMAPVAAVLGVDISLLSRWETGSRRVDSDTSAEIEKAIFAAAAKGLQRKGAELASDADRFAARFAEGAR
jgi:transcriptional regulator with XRE-family HTH domain